MLGSLWSAIDRVVSLYYIAYTFQKMQTNKNRKGFKMVKNTNSIKNKIKKFTNQSNTQSLDSLTESQKQAMLSFKSSNQSPYRVIDGRTSRVLAKLGLIESGNGATKSHWRLTVHGRDVVGIATETTTETTTESSGAKSSDAEKITALENRIKELESLIKAMDAVAVKDDSKAQKTTNGSKRRKYSSKAGKVAKSGNESDSKVVWETTDTVVSLKINHPLNKSYRNYDNVTLTGISEKSMRFQLWHEGKAKSYNLYLPIASCDVNEDSQEKVHVEYNGKLFGFALWLVTATSDVNWPEN